MKLEAQVTNLELSKKLKSLNVKQESIFYYYYEEKIIGGNDLSGNEIRTDLIAVHSEDLISAFTASELLEILPHCIEKDNIQYGLTIQKGHKHYYLIYDTHTMDNDWCRNEILIENDGNYLCEALAKMLITLIEQKIIEV